MNAVDIFSPTGSVTYSRDESGLPVAQNINVSPTAQNTIQRQEQLANDLTRIAAFRSGGIPIDDFTLEGAPFDVAHAASRIGQYNITDPTSGQSLPYDPQGYGDLDVYDQRVTDAYFDQQKRLLDPIWDDKYDALEQNLADRGFGLNKGFQDSVSRFNQDRDNAYQAAADQAILAGGQEASRRIGLEQDLRTKALNEGLQLHQQHTADVSNVLDAEQKLRSSAIQDDLLGRNQNINEISTLLQGSPAMQVPTAPQVPTYRLQAPDVIGTHFNSYNAANQNYQNQLAANSSAWQGAAGIASGVGQLAMKSSKAFKHDDGEPGRIIDLANQLRVRTWRYTRDIDPRQELHIGPYAEDWHRVLGLGDGKDIAVVDAFGITLKCIQELHEEVRELKTEVEELRKRKR